MGKIALSSLRRQIWLNVVEKLEAPACPPAPKVDPRVRRTRKLLEDALRGLLAERPLSEISVGDIADRATLNRATFYAHFEDKSHLAATMLSDDLHDAIVKRLAPPKSFDAESLTAFTAGAFEFMARTLQGCPKHADEFGSIVGTTLQETLQRFLYTWLDLDPRAMRAFFPGADKDTVAAVLAWSIYGAAIRWSRLNRRTGSAEAAREIVSLLLREPSLVGSR
jgi:AcrR family transcriptional regulator